MTGNWRLLIIFVLIMALSLAGCAGATPEENPPQDNSELEALQEQIGEKDAEIESLTTEVSQLQEELAELQAAQPEEPVPLSTGPTPGASLLTTAMEVIDLIEDINMSDLDVYVHPSKGVRFSPYDYVDLQNDIVIQAAQFQNLVNSPVVNNWGEFDGTGDPINMTFDDYYDRFIYDADFANPEMIGNNYKIGTGNIINNVDTKYPNGQFVEFHFTGFDPQYDGMDWRSLKLVFEDHNGAWHLVGIIHGEWTI
ncbi:MAG: coiled-coil domain-containing protein [Bacillota bacterium]